MAKDYITHIRWDFETLAHGIDGATQASLPEPRSINEIIKNMAAIGLVTVLGSSYYDRQPTKDAKDLLLSLLSRTRQAPTQEIIEKYQRGRDCGESDVLKTAIRKRFEQLSLEDLSESDQQIISKSLHLLCDGQITLDDLLNQENPNAELLREFLKTNFSHIITDL